MKISKIRPVKTPERGTGRSAGIDFFVPEGFETIMLEHGKSVRILSGIRVEVPQGYALIAFNKSGIALKGLQVGACVIDEDYQGEVSLHVFNTFNQEPIKIEANQKLVQFILVPVSYDNIEVIDDSEMHPEETERGEGGFGSTNEKESVTRNDAAEIL